MRTQPSQAQNNLPALSIALGLAGGIFILDFMTPRGMAPQMLYAVAILVSVWTYNQRIVKLLAWLCTVLYSGVPTFGNGRFCAS